jgi:hypothetical protein
VADEKRILDVDELDHLLTRVQDGVVSRSQILAIGGSDGDIARMIRRRELVVVHPGVYVNHTGQLSRAQQEWAAVLYYWPAALCHESALPKPSRTGPVHVAVDARRHRRALSNVTLQRVARTRSSTWRHPPLTCSRRSRSWRMHARRA